MNKRERRRLLEAAPLSRNTERTVVSPDLIEEELKVIKKEGVGYDNEEFLSGIVAIAVPVFDKSNRVCFTVAVHAPTTRMLADQANSVLRKQIAPKARCKRSAESETRSPAQQFSEILSNSAVEYLESFVPF